MYQTKHATTDLQVHLDQKQGLLGRISSEQSQLKSRMPERWRSAASNNASSALKAKFIRTHLDAILKVFSDDEAVFKNAQALKFQQPLAGNAENAFVYDQQRVDNILAGMQQSIQGTQAKIPSIQALQLSEEPTSQAFSATTPFYSSGAVKSVSAGLRELSLAQLQAERNRLIQEYNRQFESRNFTALLSLYSQILLIETQTIYEGPITMQRPGGLDLTFKDVSQEIVALETAFEAQGGPGGLPDDPIAAAFSAKLSQPIGYQMDEEDETILAEMENKQNVADEFIKARNRFVRVNTLMTLNQQSNSSFRKEIHSKLLAEKMMLLTTLRALVVTLKSFRSDCIGGAAQH